MSVSENTQVRQTATIINGQLNSPTDLSNQINIHENNITISPLKNSTIILYLINENSIKQNITVNFLEQHAEVNIFGLYRGHETQLLEITTKINHNVPHCTSRQLWKGVLTDSAKANFEGHINVAPHAQKTIAHLSNKNLLLSSTSEVFTRPFLEINANDVQCTHGATVGCLDNDAIFYLRSRGLSEQAARELLIEAFANEILDKCERTYEN